MNLGKILSGSVGGIFRRPKSKKWRAARYGLLTLTMAYVGVLAFPGFLFAHYHQQGYFRVWSDEPIDPSIDDVLKTAQDLLVHSPLYVPGMVHRIYICNDSSRMMLLARGDKAFGVTYLLRHNTFLNRSEIPSDRIFRATPHQNERPLSSVIAHERVHALILAHYGLPTEYQLPTWKKEGYCEYVAGHPSFDLEEGKRLIREGREGKSPSFRYLQYYLMVKYVLDVERRSVDELLSNSFDESNLRLKVRETIDKL